MRGQCLSGQKFGGKRERKEKFGELLSEGGTLRKRKDFGGFPKGPLAVRCAV